ncbi:MAG: hypothetical protein II610_08805 [Treponema sp.]|nr:hypothetical protein [Treponema sp.]
MESKKTRGGARAGAGRKTTGEAGKTSVITVRISPGEKATIEAKAKQAGKSVSRYIIDLALSAL